MHINLAMHRISCAFMNICQVKVPKTGSDCHSRNVWCLNRQTHTAHNARCASTNHSHARECVHLFYAKKRSRNYWIHYSHAILNSEFQKKREKSYAKRAVELTNHHFMDSILHCWLSENLFTLIDGCLFLVVLMENFMNLILHQFTLT